MSPDSSHGCHGENTLFLNSGRCLQVCGGALSRGLPAAHRAEGSVGAEELTRESVICFFAL